MVCRECGKEFIPKSRGRKNNGFCCHYCSDKYRKKMQPFKYSAVCEFCGKTFETNNAGQRFCSVGCRGAASSGRTVYHKICEYCGQPFDTLYPKYRFCSSACASRKNAEEMRGRNMQTCQCCGKAYYTDHPKRSKYCSMECYEEMTRRQVEEHRKQREEEYERRHTMTCPVCGTTFWAKMANTVYCSAQCRDTANRHYEPRVFLCRECGQRVEPEYGDKRTVFCSSQCSKRYTNRLFRKECKEKRKMLIREAYVEPVSLPNVFRRDKGICQICGLPVPMDTSPENMWGATVDHIVPLSIGGEHSMRNCQLSHRLCNSIKGQESFTEVDWESIAEENELVGERLDELFMQIGSKR